MMNVRIADLKDFEKIMKIYKYAQDYMIQSGNPTQWGHFYPDEELIRSDIHQNACKVIYDENGIHGVCALFEGADPTYEHIEDGNWLNDKPYLTIHRLAGDGQVHGLFQCVADYCKNISRNIRVDTHANNRIMQKLMETSVYKGYKQDKIEMRGDRAEMSDFPLYLNTVAGGLDRRDQTIGGFSFVVKIYAVPVVEIIG